MAGEINYKQKYQELKAKYMNAVDMAFRLGVEEGMKQSQLDQANQQLAEAQAQQQAMAGGDPTGGQPGDGSDTNNNGAPGVPSGGGPDMSGSASVQPPPPAGAAQGAVPMKESENPQGSELDQHISTLEGMLNKSEGVNPADLILVVNKLQSLRKSMHDQAELAKSAAAIPKIAAALHKPQFKFGVQANHNLSTSAKAAVSMQHKIVNEVMQKWEQEEQKAGKDILSTLSIEGITKGE